MSRVRKIFTVILPSMLAGGLVFGSAFGYAAHGRDEDAGIMLASNDVAAESADGTRRAPPRRTAQGPTPPRPPRPPTPPTPPRPPQGHRGVSISITNGKLDISGIDHVVRAQLDGVRQMLRHNPNIPPRVRDKALARIERVQAVLERRLAKLQRTDLDKLDDELEKLGEELEAAMEGLEEEMEALGDEVAKDLAKQLGKDFGKNFGPKGSFKFKFDSNNHTNNDDDADEDHDVADAIPMSPDLDGDDGDLRQAIGDLKDLALKPGQKAQIVKLRSDSDRNVAAAKKQLDELSQKLETVLADPRASDAEIGRYVDQISSQEATIRKARILAWVNARRILDDSQRRRIEDAAKRKNK
ncbi:MAG: hypothetical protein M3680_34120 [Myxococcota bacterium]|nr:hypothetical protein [Myxococcota bacterium]